MDKNIIVIPEVIAETIKSKYYAVRSEALLRGYPINNIKVHLRSDLAKALDIDEHCFFGFFPDGDLETLPVVFDDSIQERRLEDDPFTSDVLIYDPEWLI